ncbi:hypothetical protein EGM88_10680 [Aureibaculum marinum]|uniref:DUF3240 domain-containing protein n=1 Tax=Aureibaculum marinum TaxID=2487930 RepID=A0A3N4NSU3_9FLAO|nr:hypothetical protein [Aureibaculum marinum]RPD96146.1 hypothetical protein EGM88_10680 [Aureibaculum marinum]
MKLLIITAVAAYDKAIRQMLKISEVKTFSYQNVKGFRGLPSEVEDENWFGSSRNESQSILYYAFVENKNVDQLFKLVEEFNGKQEVLSKVHLAVVNIERSN